MSPEELKNIAAPCDKMTLAELAILIQQGNERANGFGRAEAVERYYQGWAINLAHDKCHAEGKFWKHWCDEHRINRMSASRFLRLYLAANEEWADEAVKHVAQHTVTELYLQFGIVKHQQAQDKREASEPKSNAKAPVKRQNETHGDSNEAADDVADKSAEPEETNIPGLGEPAIIPFPGRDKQKEQAHPPSNDGTDHDESDESGDFDERLRGNICELTINGLGEFAKANDIDPDKLIIVKLCGTECDAEKECAVALNVTKEHELGIFVTILAGNSKKRLQQDTAS